MSPLTQLAIGVPATLAALVILCLMVDRGFLG